MTDSAVAYNLLSGTYSIGGAYINPTVVRKNTLHFVSLSVHTAYIQNEGKTDV